MLQRKVVLNRFGIQGDAHDKADKRPRNSETELSQYQDCKNRSGGHDFKKVLKKSRLVKLSGNEGSRLLPAVIKSLPEKQPPTSTVPGNISAKAAAMQPKQSPVVRTSIGSPNYMKSTSSSNARVDRAKATDTSSREHKSSGQQKSTKTASLKPNVKVLTRLPSLKLTRGLKKIPSFRHVKLVVGANNGLKVGVCADKDHVQRATCSSTLKDSKFPGYLKLKPGGTESDGTSIWKVCTYKYCSLNGHFHAPLPPLKAFLTAKRRLLETEKVMKLEALTRQANESKDGPDSPEEEEYLQIKDVGTEFFIEVHDGSCMNQDLKNQKQIECGVKMESFDDVKMISNWSLDDGKGEEYDEHGVESVSTRSPRCEIDYDDDELVQQFDLVSTGTNNSMLSHEESNKGDEDEEVKDPGRGEMNEPDCDAFQIEWEEGQHIEPCSDKYELDCVQLTESESPVKPECKQLDGGSSICSEKIGAGEVVHDELDLDLADELNGSENDSVSMVGPGGEASASSDERNSGCIVENEILRTIGRASEDDDTNCSTVIAEEPCFVEYQEHLMEVDAEPEVDVCQEKVVADSICEQTRFVGQQNDGSAEKNGVTEVEADESLTTTTFDPEQEIPNTDTEDTMEKIDNLDESESISNMTTSYPTRDFSEAVLECSEATDDNEAIQDCHDNANADEIELGNYDVDEASCSLLENHEDIEDLNYSEIYSIEPEKCEYSYSADSKENARSEESAESDQLIAISADDNGEPGAIICLNADTLPSENAGFYARANGNAEELPGACTNLKLTIGNKRLFPDGAEERNFNPHEPNYLPLTPDPEAEKVDLRHQTEDERKNSEEWMLDYALRQAVTKLTPTRSKRVALLVEAFETVKPKPKFETDQRLTPASFTGVRPLQTCI